MFSWTTAPKHLSRQDQVAALRATVATALPVTGDPTSFDLGLQLAGAPPVTLRMRVTLPQGFPEAAAPEIYFILPHGTRVVHPWLDDRGRFVRCPELLGWAPTRNLGASVNAIYQHFGVAPPQVHAPSAAPAHQVGASQHAAQQPSPQGGAPQQQVTPAPQRPRIAVPPLPATWPSVDRLTLAQLQQLLESPRQRDALLRDAVPALRDFRATARATVAATVAEAAAIATLQGNVSAAAVRLASAEAANSAARERALAVMRSVRSVMERTSPVALARELDAAANDHDRTSDALTESFLAAGGAAVASGGGGTAAGGGGVKAGGGGGGGAGGVAWSDSLRSFKDEYLLVRRNYHSARIRAGILRSGGLAT